MLTSPIMADHADDVWSRAWRGVTRQLDRIIPASRRAEGGDELRRLRLCTALVASLMVLVALPILDQAVRGHVDQSLILLGSATILPVLLWSIARGASSTVVGHGISALMLVQGIVSTLSHGGIHSPATFSLVIVPFIHTVVVRDRSNWLWCGLTIAAAIMIASMTPGSVLPAREKAVAASMLTLVLTAITSLVERSRQRNVVALTEARLEAEAAAEAKSRFLANMSHEIRTPLNGVLGMLGILLETRLEKQQHDYARTAHASGVTLLDLINDILDFSKIEAGQMLLEATPFDLRALAEEVLDQVAVAADDKGLELVTRYVPGTPTHVVGDPGRIRQILLNLVNNAVKFTEEGHVLLTIEEVDTPEETPLFRCSVEDTGVGIAAQAQERIFEHFAQVDTSASRQYEGTGLGLAIVRELTALMNGRVGLKSEEGQGSTFFVELPLPVSKIPTETRPEQLAGLRLLVVDDNRVNRWVLREQLARWGFRLEEAANGPRALEMLTDAAERGLPFDIAILDYHMPRMDGLELTRAIKANPAIEGTVLIMLSSMTHRAQSDKLLEAGCAAYLIKPVHQSDLVNTLVTTWDGDSDEPSRVEAIPEPEPVMALVRSRRILVVEDNAVNQKVAVRMLTSLGAHVDVVGDGVEAVAQVEAFPYDLVFMDIQMPRMDGLEATRQIRRREQDGAHLEIVAMTAHAQAEDRERCLEAGMDGYVRKPMVRRDLLRALRQHLGSAPSKVESEPVEPTVGELPTAPCDLEWLRANYDPDPAALRELLSVFVSDATALLGQIAMHLSAGDQRAVRRSVHTLVGQCGTVRAHRLHDQLTAKAPVDVPALRQELARLVEYLQRTIDLDAAVLDGAGEPARARSSQKVS